MKMNVSRFVISQVNTHTIEPISLQELEATTNTAFADRKSFVSQDGPGRYASFSSHHCRAHRSNAGAGGSRRKGMVMRRILH